MEKIKITKDDLHPSSTLSDAGMLIFKHTWPDGTVEECPVYGIVSEECATEEEAVASFKKKLATLVEKLKSDKYYMMYNEMKVWHGKNRLGGAPDRFAAYAQVVLPGLSPEMIRNILNLPQLM